jgi:hypothetical protein
MRISFDAIPRRYGARAAALSFRAAGANGANFASFLPNGSALPFALINSSALVIAQIERSSHSLITVHLEKAGLRQVLIPQCMG